MVAPPATTPSISEPRNADPARVPLVPGSDAQRHEPEPVRPGPSSSVPLSPSAPASSPACSFASSAFNPAPPPRPSDFSATSAFSSPCPSAPLPLSPSAPSSPSPSSLCPSDPLPLLHALIRADFDLTALLDDPRFTPDQVIAFLADPDTQAKVADIAKIAHLGLTIRAAAARHVAIQTLEHVAKTTDDLVEKRRAATALFRATASPLVPLAKRATGCLPTSANNPTSPPTGSRATGCGVGGPTSAPNPPSPSAPSPLTPFAPSSPWSSVALSGEPASLPPRPSAALSPLPFPPR
jgi:hypothetical protein